MSNPTEDYALLADEFTSWWRGLQSLGDASGKPIRRGKVELAPNRAALARLRRINVIADLHGAPVVDIGSAMDVAEFRDLIARIAHLPFQGKAIRQWLSRDTPTLDPFAIAAAALARVREDSSSNERHKIGSTARLLGEGESRLLAEVRFKRLMRCRNDWPDLMIQARRIAAILERRAPVGDLGASIVLWNAEPRIVQDWAFQYYQEEFESFDDASPAVPSITPPTA